MQATVNPQSVIDLLKLSLPSTGVLPLHEPGFFGNEWDYVKDCLDTGWVSTQGHYADRFEQSLVEYTGAKHAVTTVNATAALHTSLLLSGVVPQDEVLLPTLSFVAAANTVTYCQAVPHFIDVHPSTLGVNPQKLADYLKDITVLRDDLCINRHTGRRIGALIVVHAFGYPADLNPLLELCQQYQIPLIEDAADSIGSFYQDAHTGTFGLMGVLSFSGKNVLTTGGGGAILTNDDQLAQQAKHLTTTAKVIHPWELNHDQVGFNYQLPNINAALGLAQLEQIDDILAKKRVLAQHYQKLFDTFAGVHMFDEPLNSRSNYWLNLLQLDHSNKGLRDELLKLGHENDLMFWPAWRLLHNLPMFMQTPRMDLSISEQLENQIICLPSSPQLVNESLTMPSQQARTGLGYGVFADDAQSVKPSKGH